MWSSAGFRFVAIDLLAPMVSVCGANCSIHGCSWRGRGGICRAGPALTTPPGPQAPPTAEEGLGSSCCGICGVWGGVPSPGRVCGALHAELACGRVQRSLSLMFSTWEMVFVSPGVPKGRTHPVRCHLEGVICKATTAGT